jgi:hypothetical protein
MAEAKNYSAGQPYRDEAPSAKTEQQSEKKSSEKQLLQKLSQQSGMNKLKKNDSTSGTEPTMAELTSMGLTVSKTSQLL